jgi:hypothetical protein
VEVVGLGAEVKMGREEGLAYDDVNSKWISKSSLPRRIQKVISTEFLQRVNISIADL